MGVMRGRFRAGHGTGHRSALGVADHHHELRMGMLAGVFQAGQHVVTDHVACDSGVKDVANALVKNQLAARARVDAAQHAGEGMLALRMRLVHLLFQIAVQRSAQGKAGIAALETRQGLIGRDVFLLSSRDDGRIRRQAGAADGDEEEGGEENVEGVHGLPL